MRSFRVPLLFLFAFSLLWMALFTPLQSGADPENALYNYLKRDEPVYSWTLKEKKSALGLDIYDLLLVSQTWQNIVWTHQLRIAIPQNCPDTHAALLFVTGGSNKDGQPKWKSWKGDKHDLITNIADASKRPVAIISQVPNQPLYGEMVEDDLISHTFLKYMETRDETWPLLFPMAKSAIQAMNAIQEFTKKELKMDIHSFVVSGASKRGWTTWLTGASGDRRVIGIGPMVIDTINMRKQMDYQLTSWGQYSEQIDDYTRKGIQQKMDTPEGIDLWKMVDPYTYRQNITMPKLLFMGTNDPYWPVDAVKNYFDDLLGEKSISYTPNAGHDLGGGEQAARALGAFFAFCAEGKKPPQSTWSLKENGKEAIVQVKTDFAPKAAKVWIASSTDRDFRDNVWKDALRADKEGDVYTARVPYPESGLASFYVDLVYPSPIGGEFTQSTQIYILTPEGLVKD